MKIENNQWVKCLCVMSEVLLILRNPLGIIIPLIVLVFWPETSISKQISEKNLR